MFVGGRGDSFKFNAEKLTGDMSELIVAGSVLTGYDVASLDAYLIQKHSIANLTPAKIVYSVSGNQWTLSWPADHTGWRLQGQTNSFGVGLTTNWSDVPNATSTNQMTFPIGLTNGACSTGWFILSFIAAVKETRASRVRAACAPAPQTGKDSSKRRHDAYELAHSAFARAARSVLAVTLASITLGALAEPAAPVGLLVNGVSNPLAIDRDATRFTWMSQDTEPGSNANRVSNPGRLQPRSVWPREQQTGGTAARWIRTNRLRLNTPARRCLPPRGSGGKCGFGTRPAKPALTARRPILTPD